MSKKEPSVSASFMASVMQSPLYPLNYVKVLIQIGHEPLPPFKSRSIFGREQLFYPNSFSYLRYIYSVEGLTGCYRGLGMKFISNTVGTFVNDKVTKLMDEAEEQNESEAKKSERERSVNSLVKQTSKDITAKCWAVIFSHPFHVMGLRCMAQFIGGETRYSSWNVIHNTIEIYQGEGLRGFFSGLIPRLLFEASTIAITNALAYLIKTYIFEDKEIDALIDLFASLIANSVTYPLSLVSTVSCISGSALIAGQPPRMAVYVSWIDAFKHLYENNELKRGSSSFFRIYSPPVNYVPQGFVLNSPQKKFN